MTENIGPVWIDHASTMKMTYMQLYRPALDSSKKHNTRQIKNKNDVKQRNKQFSRNCDVHGVYTDTDN